jgi:hypothetical protein
LLNFFFHLFNEEGGFGFPNIVDLSVLYVTFMFSCYF